MLCSFSPSPTSDRVQYTSGHLQGQAAAHNKMFHRGNTTDPDKEKKWNTFTR